MKQWDLAVVGGGIVGLATAYQFTQRHPGRSVVVLEKENRVAAHQTGRNSGVLHSGIYYLPGSQKAATCRIGKRMMEAFCAAEGVPFEICGKVIVAVRESDVPALFEVHRRGQANGVRCQLIDRNRLVELEPHANGVRAIHVTETGIVDFVCFCSCLVKKIRKAEGDVILNTRVLSIGHFSSEVVVQTTVGDFHATRVATCPGVYADRVARMSGRRPALQVVPIRGEYYKLKPSAQKFCQNLIYPTPNLSFPFLGVHFTRMIDGSVECGPNAVLAFGREAYSFSQANIRDVWEMVRFRGFRRMAWKHWRMGLGEMYRSLRKSAFVNALQRLVPQIQASDLEPAPAGIRAQALLPNGDFADDYFFKTDGRVLNVLNAPSPAATASLRIGEVIVDHLA